jgi:HK97 family phage prohead protease
MNKQYIKAEVKKEGNRIVFVASDETLDRQGEVISLDSWDLRNFKKNPVLLVDHEYKVENIVGTARNIKVDKDRKALTFEPSFHGITQLSQDVAKMVEAGELNTVSVGFMPVYPKKDGDQIQNELLEISFVAVPANPNANMIMNGMSLETLELSIKSFVNESIEKEGRTLSKKTRGMMMDAVSAMAKAIETMNDLITTADGEDEIKSIVKDLEEEVAEVTEDTEEIIDDSEKQETLTTDEIKVEGEEPQNSDVLKEALKAIAHKVNGALYEMNKKY